MKNLRILEVKKKHFISGNGDLGNGNLKIDHHFIVQRKILWVWFTIRYSANYGFGDTGWPAHTFPTLDAAEDFAKKLCFNNKVSVVKETVCSC